MSQLLIRNLPDSLHRRLKERARRHRRSMAKEVIVLLEEALATDIINEQEPPRPFIGAFSLTDQWLDAAKQEGRS